jgi:hypothetical protein
LPCRRSWVRIPSAASTQALRHVATDRDTEPEIGIAKPITALIASAIEHEDPREDPAATSATGSRLVAAALVTGALLPPAGGGAIEQPRTLGSPGIGLEATRQQLIQEGSEMTSALVPLIAVGTGIVVIAVAVAVVVVALIVLSGMRQHQKRHTEQRADARELRGMRQRQKRHSEQRADARELRDEARERTERAERERDEARERTERAEEIDPDR